MKTLFQALGLVGALTWLSLPAAAQNTPQPSHEAAAVTMVDTPTTAKLLRQPGVVLLDVRTPAEFATGHVLGAQNIDFRAADFSDQVAVLDPSLTYVLYCASGNRSGQAAKLMQEQGLLKVVNAGAFKALKDSGLETE